MKTFFRFVPLFILIFALAGLGYLGFRFYMEQEAAKQVEENPFLESGVSVVSEEPEETLPPTPTPEPEPSVTEAPAAPKTAASFTTALEDPEIADKVSSMSLEQKVDQLFFLTPEALVEACSAADEPLDEAVVRAGGMTKTAISEHPVGGILYLRANLVGEDQTRELLFNTKDYYKQYHRPEPFVAVTEEGGSALAIGGRTEVFNAEAVESPAEIGYTEDPDAAEEAGHVIARYLDALGFTMDLAPVANVLNAENELMASRCFGADASLVQQMTEAFAGALIEHEIVPVWKHFPGIAGTTGDTPAGESVSEKTKEELIAEDLVPYANAAELAPCIMVGHVSFPKITGDNTPASLSSAIVTDLLRTEYGFDGVVMTDALNMKAVTDKYGAGDAAVLAVEAGCDMLLLPADYPEARQALLDAVADGQIAEERIDASVARILRVKNNR